SPLRSAKAHRAAQKRLPPLPLPPYGERLSKGRKRMAGQPAAGEMAARFQALHEFIRAARNALPTNYWDYLTGGAETETTLKRNRLALDSLAFRPRVLRDVSAIDTTSTLFGKKMRLPVVLAPVGSIESLDPGGTATVAKAAASFGVPLFVSSVAQPGLEATAA